MEASICRAHFFQTPYYWGKIDADAHVPAFITFEDGAGTMFRVQTSGARPCLRGEDEMWQGTLYLPHSNISYAKLGSYTEAYPFTSADKIEMQASRRTPVFQWLAESQFAPQEWQLRNNATHTRSKTYPRSA